MCVCVCLFAERHDLVVADNVQRRELSVRVITIVVVAVSLLWPIARISPHGVQDS